MHADAIQQLIETGLSPCQVTVEGEDGVHFKAIVTAASFAGKTRIQQQQMVYATLGNRIHDGTIHALSVSTRIPS